MALLAHKTNAPNFLNIMPYRRKKKYESTVTITIALVMYQFIY